MSFHCRVIYHLLMKSSQNVIKALGMNVLQVLIGTLESLKKAINFNSIVGQPLSMRAHIQVKQIVRAVFDSIDLILGRIIQVGSSYTDSTLAKQIMITYATVFSIPDFGDELFEVSGSAFLSTITSLN